MEMRGAAAAGALVVLAVAGIVESARLGQGGSLTLFALVLAVAVIELVVRPRGRRVEIRPDLSEWLETTAAVTGEHVGDVVTRAVSAYRAHLAAPTDG